MAEQIIIDPAAEDATRSEVVIPDAGNGLDLPAENPFTFPRVEHDIQTAATMWEGDFVVGRTPKSVEIVVRVRITGTSTANFEDRIARLENKIGLLARDGGMLQRIPNNGNSLTWDVRHAEMELPDDWYVVNRFTAVAELFFLCAPAARGPVQTYSAASETALPALLMTAATVQGSLPGLGVLTVTDLQGAAQAEVRAGLQQRYYNAGTTHRLFYEAEWLTPTGGASAGALTGASGGTAVRHTSLSTLPRTILRTPYVAGAVAQQHTGEFRVCARVVPVSSESSLPVYLRWEYGQGASPRLVANTAVELETPYSTTAFRQVDLGVMTLPPPKTGTQQWEGRLSAWTNGTAADLAVDCIELFPVGESYVEMKARVDPPPATTLSAFDGFDQSTGSLTGKTAPTGGTWSGFGDSDDFALITGASVAMRTALSDSSTGPAAGRRVTLNVNMTATVIEATLAGDLLASLSATSGWGVVARDNGSTDFAALLVRLRSGGRAYLSVWQGNTMIAEEPSGIAMVDGSGYPLRFMIDAAGGYYGWLSQVDGVWPSQPQIRGFWAAFATGGALASGDVGVIDWHTSAEGSQRYIQVFAAWVPDVDAVVHPARAAQWRYDGAIRQDSGGVAYSAVGEQVGTSLYVPPAGQEARTSRIMVVASRQPWNIPGGTSIDDVQAQLQVVPRFYTRRP